jgi:hypothetical protein
MRLSPLRGADNSYFESIWARRNSGLSKFRSG